MFGGEYAAPVMMVGVVLSLIVKMSMLVEFGYGMSSVSMPVRVAITKSPVGVL